MAFSERQERIVARMVAHLDMSEFARAHRSVARVFTAGGLAALAVLAALAGGWVFSLWILVFLTMTAMEWHGIAYGAIRTPAFATHMTGAVLSLGLMAAGQAELAFVIAGLTALASMLAASLAKKDPVWALLGVFYTLLPAIMLVWLRAVADPGAATLCWIFGLVWATDMAALGVGKWIGGPKLSPRVSPGKTWAGLAGGVAGAALVGAFTGSLVPGASSLTLAVLSGLLAVVAQLGDLTESAFKRRFGVKDSGVLIPGQGGVLDRVDGLIFVAVAVAALAWASGGGVLILGVHP